MTETSQSTRNTEKLLVAKTILSMRQSVFVHLDPATFSERISLPEYLRAQAQTVLQLGFNMPIPIPDLRVDEEGVYGTLSFKGVLYTCQVPWEAVFALVGDDAKGKVWHEDMPRELTSAMGPIVADSLESKKTSPYIKPLKRERPEWLKVIKGDKK